MAPKPDSVVKAVQLLERSETVPDHEQRARQIKEAFDLLNAHLKASPASEHREYVENCKVSYIRSHLKRLSVLDEPDRETWLLNFLLFATSEREVTQVLEQHPELRPWYDAFEQSCLDWATKELMPLLETAANKRRRQ